jgi:hypothetical protein
MFYYFVMVDVMLLLIIYHCYHKQQHKVEHELDYMFHFHHKE